MRRALWFAGALLVTSGLVHCVGDDPGTVGDAGQSDDGGGVIDDDSPSTSDASRDAGPADSGNDGGGPVGDQCIGHADCPSNVEPANLALWLRANAGLNCAGGRVAVWNDQSSKGHNATPPVYFEAGTSTGLAPQCGVEAINGIGVVTFTDPVEADAGAYTQFIDETLDFDGTILHASDYTIFVVDRRAGSQYEWLFGFDRSVPPGTLLVSCGIHDTEDSLAFGFELPSGMQALGYSQVCSGGNGPGAATSTQPELIELVYSSATGHSLYANGAAVFTGSGTGGDLEGISATSVRHGTLGRAFNVFDENRFKGSVAEIIAYGVTLTPTERGQVETYLKRQWGLTF